MDAPKKEITPENLLLSAALAGDTSTVETLIANGISVNAKGDKVRRGKRYSAPGAAWSCQRLRCEPPESS